MPLICSRTLRGLDSTLVEAAIGEVCPIRVCHRLNGVESAIDYQLDVSCRQTCNALYECQTEDGNVQEINNLPRVRIRVWGHQEVLRLHLRALIELRLSPQNSL